MVNPVLGLQKYKRCAKVLGVGVLKMESCDFFKLRQSENTKRIHELKGLEFGILVLVPMLRDEKKSASQTKSGLLCKTGKF